MFKETKVNVEEKNLGAPSRRSLRETAFGCPRDFLENRFIYAVISPRARGLSLGVNLNPDQFCDFDCLYCEVDRQLPPRASQLDIEAMAGELHQTLQSVYSGELRHRPRYAELPDDLLQLRHVSLSGDGEPTRCPQFVEAVLAVMHIRASAGFPFFKIVLVTNASGLDLPTVQRGLGFFTKEDEIWAKLDAGTQSYMDRVNQPQVPLEKIMANLTDLGRKRPIIIQSLFPMIHGQQPPWTEVEEFANRLNELKAAGTQISLVQIYSATRPSARSYCGHLPLSTLSRIARFVRENTGLRAEVF